MTPPGWRSDSRPRRWSRSPGRSFEFPDEAVGRAGEAYSSSGCATTKSSFQPDCAAAGAGASDAAAMVRRNSLRVGRTASDGMGYRLPGFGAQDIAVSDDFKSYVAHRNAAATADAA